MRQDPSQPRSPLTVRLPTTTASSPLRRRGHLPECGEIRLGFQRRRRFLGVLKDWIGTDRPWLRAYWRTTGLVSAPQVCEYRFALPGENRRKRATAQDSATKLLTVP